MAHARKILIADPELEAVRPLSKALRQKGYQVHYAPDGSRALEIAVLRHPDLVLIDDECKLIDARTFGQILRTNPRTEEIPVVLTTPHFEADKLRGLRDGYLRKPFNLDEVLSRIEHIFHRAEAAKDLEGDSREIRGSLSQLSIPDLLQIMSMNKRTGRLKLERSGESGEIIVMEGRPVNARLGRVDGEKALFRLLGWTEGTFAFMPGTVPSRPRISREMDDALLEGMRQNDELERLLPQLPPRNARIQLAPSADLPRDQHPVTAEVVELLRQPRTLTDVLDLASSSDLEVVGVLGTLLQKKVARIVEGDLDEGKGPLLGPAEVHALRSRLLRGRSPAKVAIAKVFLCASGPAAPRAFLRQLPGLELTSADPPAARSGFGTLGRFEISEALKIDFCVLPSVEAARPLWRPFTSGAVGGLLLDDGSEALEIAAFLAFDLRVPVVTLGGPVPARLERAPAGAEAGGSDPSEALQALLIQTINPGRAREILESTLAHAL